MEGTPRRTRVVDGTDREARTPGAPAARLLVVDAPDARVGVVAGRCRRPLGHLGAVRDPHDVLGDDLPVEVVAVLAETDISVAQLAALSLGQVIPLGMENESVRLYVDGGVVMTGRSGSRNGNYAVKIENITGSTE